MSNIMEPPSVLWCVGFVWHSGNASSGDVKYFSDEKSLEAFLWRAWLSEVKRGDGEEQRVVRAIHKLDLTQENPRWVEMTYKASEPSLTEVVTEKLPDEPEREGVSEGAV